jgi:hypothetical protein
MNKLSLRARVSFILLAVLTSTLVLGGTVVGMQAGSGEIVLTPTVDVQMAAAGPGAMA